MKSRVINLRDKKAETKSRGIIFSAPMVRAILAGKTQTRRIVRPQPTFDVGEIEIDENGYLSIRSKAKYGRRDCSRENPIGTPHEGLGTPCPFGKVGDELWVRETWQRANEFEVTEGAHPRGKGIVFAADQVPPYGFTGRPWRSPIHLRRADSRIRLKIVRVRVERVNEISEADARAEGFTGSKAESWLNPGKFSMVMTARDDFERLWNMLHGPRSFDAGSWVWVLDFARVAEGGKP